jgi:hypothetical protein
MIYIVSKVDRDIPPYSEVFVDPEVTTTRLIIKPCYVVFR